MDYGKDLPPLTLSSTSVSCLVTLIPVLVSMTTHGEVPSYEDETDKPAWWPSDIQWRNPKFYVQDADKKDGGLKVLRKLVYSCYSYHGVEDLLCRLDETPISDSEPESGENMEIIQLAEEEDEVIEHSSEESEGSVFVCCFCLDQFSSHASVSAHQNACIRRFKDSNPGSRTVILGDKTQVNAITKPATTKNCHTTESALEPDEYSSTSSSDNAPDFLNEMVPPSSAQSLSHIPLLKTLHRNDGKEPSQISASSSAATALINRRPPTTTSVPFVPTLKTRSQKKLDQIMEKHNLRCMMLEECSQMKDVPKNGAWWTRKKRRKYSNEPQHPTMSLSQNTFTSALGLVQAIDVAALAKKGPKLEQEVDLDCEIISVEGPLSTICQPLPPPKVVEKPTSSSPRSTRSLMSQLSRDTEINTRRKLSFCFVEDEWADKQALNEGRDPLQISLLTLDFSSPLGQRIKKYVRGEGHLNIIKDVESYCKTELDEDGYSKLRYRGCDFRITYRKKRRASHYVHKYKFNKTDRMEFNKLLKTGLSAYSRHVKQRLPACKVVLTKLTGSQIKLWTQEKKITISEQIVFDDDICITQIDIPESRVTPGLTPDIHSSSQHQLYRQPQHLAPSSPLSAGRMHANSENKLFSPRTSASPTHVPNIFRNRTSHTSSPPRPSNVSRTHNPSSDLRPQNLTSKVRRSIGDQESLQVNCSSSLGNTSSQHKILEKPRPNLHHLTGHVSLSPSAYSVPDRSLDGTKINGDLSGTNRRKQQLTHVRKDDGDGGGSHSVVAANRNILSVGRSISNPHSRGLVGNHRSDTMQRHDRLDSPASSGQALRPSTRKLSNFDYFSIRDGKIQPSYPNHSHAVVSQHRTYTSSATHLHNHQNLGLSRQNSHHLSHNHNFQPSHSEHHHRHYNNAPQSASGQTRPSAIREFNSSQQHHPLSSNGKLDRGSFSMNRHGVNTPNTHTLKKFNTKAPSLEHLRQNTFSEDDDVMEVICIDDD